MLVLLNRSCWTTTAGGGLPVRSPVHRGAQPTRHPLGESPFCAILSAQLCQVCHGRRITSLPNAQPIVPRREWSGEQTARTLLQSPVWNREMYSQSPLWSSARFRPAGSRQRTKGGPSGGGARADSGAAGQDGGAFTEDSGSSGGAGGGSGGDPAAADATSEDPEPIPCVNPPIGDWLLTYESSRSACVPLATDDLRITEDGTSIWSTTRPAKPAVCALILQRRTSAARQPARSTQAAARCARPLGVPGIARDRRPNLNATIAT